MNYEIFKIEAGPGEQAQAYGRNLYRPSQGLAYRIDDPCPQPICPRTYEKQRQEQNHAQRQNSAL
jgi:hypothetical protein